MHAKDLYRLLGDKTAGDMPVKILTPEGDIFNVDDLVVGSSTDTSGTPTAWLKVTPEEQFEDTDALLAD